jgi:hypothetical protein
MFRALQCPLEEDLSGFTRYLSSQGVVHRVTEESGQQVVWTRDEAGARAVRHYYQEGTPEAVSAGPAPQVRVSEMATWQVTLRRVPLTLAVLLVTAVVALITGLGSQPDSVVLFTFVPPQSAEFMATQFDGGQWWRLITPMLLHFGLMHLVFNALWYWELGRRIELRSGSFWLLGLTLLCAVVDFRSAVFRWSFRCFVWAAWLLLDISMAGAQCFFRSAQRRRSADAGLAGCVSFGAGDLARIWRDSQCGACQWLVGGLCRRAGSRSSSAVRFGEINFWRL